MAEEYVSRLRRAEIPIAGSCPLRHAQESSRREDNRHVSDGVERIAWLALYVDRLPAAWSRVTSRLRQVRRIPHLSEGGVSLTG